MIEYFTLETSFGRRWYWRFEGEKGYRGGPFAAYQDCVNDAQMLYGYGGDK